MRTPPSSPSRRISAHSKNTDPTGIRDHESDRQLAHPDIAHQTSPEHRSDSPTDTPAPSPRFTRAADAETFEKWWSVIHRDRVVDLVVTTCNLTLLQAAVYRRIVFRAGPEDMTCWESPESMARFLGTTARSIRRALSDLEEMGRILCKGKKGKLRAWTPNLKIADELTATQRLQVDTVSTFKHPDSPPTPTQVDTVSLYDEPEATVNGPQVDTVSPYPDTVSTELKGTENVVHSQKLWGKEVSELGQTSVPTSYVDTVSVSEDTLSPNSATKANPPKTLEEKRAEALALAARLTTPEELQAIQDSEKLRARAREQTARGGGPG